MIGKEFSDILFLPPKFARANSNLIGRKTYLEDSSGQRWRVTVCNHSGSLAIREGWPNFCSEHGLTVGDFLVFHYFHGQGFIVQIFDTSACPKIKHPSDICNSGCQKIKHPSDICRGAKRATTCPEATTHDENGGSSSTDVMSSSFLKPAENGSKSDDLSNLNKRQNPHMSTFESGIPMVLRSDTGRKPKEASQFIKSAVSTQFFA